MVVGAAASSVTIVGSMASQAGTNKGALWRLQLTVKSGREQGRVCVVDRDVVTVGKMPDCDLVLTDDTVSRRHLRISRTEKGWLLVDLGSTNGTFLHGGRIREAPIDAGAVLRAGTVEIAFVPEQEQFSVPPWPDDHLGELLGRSEPMRALFGMVARISKTEATVLIQGETGTGKGLVARTIHEGSNRRDGPHIVVDCGAVQRELIESELFGHEKGAFSGAVVQRKGAFELAHGGTVFIDELGELDLDLQPKLLRVLDAREVRRIGSSTPIPVDIRVIAASRRNLAREVARGAFREDLYFRLSVVSLTVPPLRERAEDISVLAEGFLRELADKRGIEAPSLDDRLLDRFTSHDWPGNVRELKNVIERAALLAKVRQGTRLEVARLGDGRRPARETPTTGDLPVTAFDPSLSFSASKLRYVEARERDYVAWLLEQHRNNVSAAARAAKMDRKYLHKLLKKHGLGSAHK